jgi:sulfite dehydrogenase (quinone) subunit SoeC
MHPAYSIILFTTASGAGYGLLFWLALLSAFGAVPATPGLGFFGLGLAFVLISTGLIASTAHLGHPERAWRAFSQWRSSWLSREGVAAVATFVPFALFGLGWVFLSTTSGAWALFGLLAAALAITTVWCTGMIYQSLTTIRAWSIALVTPIYVVLALASGAVLALFLLRLNGFVAPAFTWATILFLALALGLKRLYWMQIDRAPRTLTAGDATGLGRFGAVRTLEVAHTQPNFVMREMGYAVARKHAEKLRGLVQTAGFGLALAATFATLFTSPTAAVFLMFVAVLAISFAVVVERWLFFAEAQHVVTLYYGSAVA